LNQRPLACEARATSSLKPADLQGFGARVAFMRGTKRRLHLQGFYTALGHGNAPWPRRAWADDGAMHDLVSARWGEDRQHRRDARRHAEAGQRVQSRSAARARDEQSRGPRLRAPQPCRICRKVTSSGRSPTGQRNRRQRLLLGERSTADGLNWPTSPVLLLVLATSRCANPRRSRWTGSEHLGDQRRGPRGTVGLDGPVVDLAAELGRDRLCDCIGWRGFEVHP